MYDAASLIDVMIVFCFVLMMELLDEACGGIIYIFFRLTQYCGLVQYLFCFVAVFVCFILG